MKSRSPLWLRANAPVQGQAQGEGPIFTPKTKLILRITNKGTPFLDLIDQRRPAALPRDVRKGFAFPMTLICFPPARLRFAGRWRHSLMKIEQFMPESHRLSVHQAAKPRTESFPANFLQFQFVSIILAPSNETKGNSDRRHCVDSGLSEHHRLDLCDRAALLYRASA